MSVLSRDPESDLIAAHYHTKTSNQIAEMLGPQWTDARVRVRAQRLGLATKQQSGNAKKIMAARERVAAMWSTHTLADIAAEVNRTIATVNAWAKSMLLPPRVPVRFGTPKPTPTLAVMPPVIPATARVVREAGRPVAIMTEAEKHYAALRAGWANEARAEEARRAHELRCICGKPGAIHCAEHRHLLQREGVL